MKVKFINVGRNKMNWTAECKGELTHEWLYREAKKALASDGIEFTDNGKIIVGGFRIVGQFEILEDARGMN